MNILNPITSCINGEIAVLELTLNPAPAPSRPAPPHCTDCEAQQSFIQKLFQGVGGGGGGGMYFILQSSRSSRNETDLL